MLIIKHIATLVSCWVAVTYIEAFVVGKPAITRAKTQLFVATSTPTKDCTPVVTTIPVEESFPTRLMNFEKYWKELSAERPGFTKQFWKLRDAVRNPDGPLDTKTKELIAIAVSVASSCDTCIAHHVYDALEAGATREEIADALGVACLMGGGVGVAFATHAMRAVDQFEEMMSEDPDFVGEE